MSFRIGSTQTLKAYSGDPQTRVGLFLSQDSGAAWQKLDLMNDVTNQSPYHTDIHAVYFSPPDGRRLFIGSDGGIIATDVVFGSPDQPWLQNFVSVFNKHLANLRFSGWSPLRSAWASFSVNDAFVADGLQDNGNVYTRWTDQSPWRQAAYSDGQLTLLFAGTDLLFDNTGDTLDPTLAPGMATDWTQYLGAARAACPRGTC
jgi:hypothetical protein